MKEPNLSLAPEAPQKRDRAPSRGFDVANSILSSSLPKEELAKALGGILDALGVGEDTPPRKRGGDPPPPPQKNTQTWIMAIFVILGLLEHGVGLLDLDSTPPPPIEVADPKELDSQQETLDSILQELRDQKVEQHEFDYFLVEAVKDLSDDSGHPEGRTSVNYLERAQERREKKK